MVEITDQLKKIIKHRDHKKIVFEKKMRKYPKKSGSTSLESYSYYEQE
jgi:hypothetical protein